MARGYLWRSMTLQARFWKLFLCLAKMSTFTRFSPQDCCFATLKKLPLHFFSCHVHMCLQWVMIIQDQFTQMLEQYYRSSTSFIFVYSIIDRCFWIMIHKLKDRLWVHFYLHINHFWEKIFSVKRIGIEQNCTGCFFQLFLPIFSTKMKKRRALLHWKFLEKVVLVGCNLFFILVLKMGRNS